MMWLTVLPLIIDLVKDASRLISELDDGSERREAKKDVRMILGDYSVHQDVPTVRGNLEQFIETRYREGSKR